MHRGQDAACVWAATCSSLRQCHSEGHASIQRECGSILWVTPPYWGCGFWAQGRAVLCQSEWRASLLGGSGSWAQGRAVLCHSEWHASLLGGAAFGHRAERCFATLSGTPPYWGGAAFGHRAERCFATLSGTPPYWGGGGSWAQGRAVLCHTEWHASLLGGAALGHRAERRFATQAHKAPGQAFLIRGDGVTQMWSCNVELQVGYGGLQSSGLTPSMSNKAAEDEGMVRLYEGIKKCAEDEGMVR